MRRSARSATTSGAGRGLRSRGHGPTGLSLPSANPHGFGGDYLDTNSVAFENAARTVDPLLRAAVDAFDPEPGLGGVADEPAEPERPEGQVASHTGHQRFVAAPGGARLGV